MMLIMKVFFNTEDELVTICIATVLKRQKDIEEEKKIEGKDQINDKDCFIYMYMYMCFCIYFLIMDSMI